MGLFRKKSKMDIPPPPPHSGEGEGAMQDMPSMPDSGTHLKSELPEIKPAGMISPAEMKKSSAKMPAAKKMPSMPEFPEIPKEEEAEPEQDDFDEEMPGMDMPEPSLEPAEIKGPKFLPAPSFQAIVAETEEIKNSLKQTDAVFSSLNKLREDEEKEFEKWKVHLEDIQKKLEYVDQLIFEGE